MTKVKSMSKCKRDIDELAQDCDNSSVLALELLQSFIKPLI